MTSELPIPVGIDTPVHDDAAEPLYEAAVALVLQHKRPAISFVQANLRIGFSRAAKMLERMERDGLVTPPAGNGTREMIAPRNTEAENLLVDDDRDPYGRVFCHQMVEDSWRSFLTFASEGSPALGVACINRLDERSQEIARGMPAGRSQRFLALIDNERGKIFDEYTKNPEALKRRLGVPKPGVGARGASGVGQGLGGLAVRTVVRATVWESIIAIFRAFR